MASDTAPAKELLAKIIPMLVKLIQLFEGGGPKRATSRESEKSIPSPSTSPAPNNRARARSP